MIISAETFLYFEYRDFTLIAYSNLIAMLAQFFYLFSVVSCCKPYQLGSIRCFRRNDFSRWSAFCGTSFSNIAMNIVGGWNAEIISLVMATLGSLTLASNNIIFSILANAWVFTALGVSVALAIFVGNAIGAHDISLARKISF